MATVLNYRRQPERDHKALLGFIERIYSAPGNLDEWGRVSRELASFLGADYSHILIFSQTGQPLLSIVEDAVCELATEYEVDYAGFDKRVRRLLRRSGDEVVTEMEIMTPEEISACPVHQEFLPKLDLRHFMACKSDFGSGSQLVSSVLRNPRSGVFDKDAQRVLSLLHPHLLRAVQLEEELRAINRQAATLGEALNLHDCGVFIVDGALRIRFSNRYAEDLLREEESIHAVDRRLALSPPARNHELSKLVHMASGRLGQRQGGALLLPRSAGRPITIRVFPLPPEMRAVGNAGSAIVLVNDPDRKVTLSRSLLASYGLTPSETDLAIALLNGETVKSYAAACGLQESTPRSQLKSILSKTQTDRQAGLVQLLVRLAEEST